MGKSQQLPDLARVGLAAEKRSDELNFAEKLAYLIQWALELRLAP